MPKITSGDTSTSCLGFNAQNSPPTVKVQYKYVTDIFNTFIQLNILDDFMLVNILFNNFLDDVFRVISHIAIATAMLTTTSHS